MCDYSLEAIQSRAAEVGDKLVSTKFSNAFTRGFSAAGNPDVAVCLLPGTEIAFDRNIVKCDPMGGGDEDQLGSNVGRFVKLETDQRFTHHDALELPDGTRVKLNDLASGQTATVLQLPMQPTISHVDIPADNCELPAPSLSIESTEIYAA